MYAVSEALTVLSWFENLPEEEQPPRHIWWSDELVADWFRNVRTKRGKASSGKTSFYEQSEDVPMMQNELIDRSGEVPVVKSAD